MAGIRSKRLNELLREASFDIEDEEVKEIEKTVFRLVQNVAENIGEEDPLFKNFVIKSGSFYEGLKAVGPDEFDYMICLEELSKPGICAARDIVRKIPDPGYVDVQIKDRSVRRRWKAYISRNENLKPNALLYRFNTLIQDAIMMKKAKRESLGRLHLEHVEVELRKIPVTVKLKWKGDKYQNYSIDVDFVLCIKMDGWPISSDIKDRVSRGHPGFHVIREVIQSGHHLVASTIGEAGKPRPCWRLSFSTAEGILLRHITENPNLVHKETVKILKVWRKRNEDNLSLFEETADVDPDSFHVSYVMTTWAFHSYVLKTMFMHEWCEFPEDSYWMKDQLNNRIQGILRGMKGSLSNRDIKSFWVPDYKLFNFRARGRTRTQKCEEQLESLIETLKKLTL